MTSYELLEIIQNLKDKVIAFLDKQQPKEALKECENVEKTIKPYLDSCAFTCSDYKDRAEFNEKARKEAMEEFKEDLKTSEQRLNCLKTYNLAQNELYSLWTSWKTTVSSVLQALKNFKKEASRLIIETKEKKA